MAGFVYHQIAVRPQYNARVNNNMNTEAPYYGYGFYYNNPGLQYVTNSQDGVFNGVGVSGNVWSQPAQGQMYFYKPYGANNTNNGSATWVGSNPYYMNKLGTQTMQGDVVQQGSFHGRGMGARVFGHFSASGDIN